MKAARGYLAGEPDPLGAAVVAYAVLQRRTGEGDGRDATWLWIDAWTAEHGLAFAACACAEVDGLALPWGDKGAEHGVQADKWSSEDAYWATGPAGKRMRSLLAVADEADYAEAVERLAGHRRTPQQRRVVSFLVPTRQDWVDECCAEPPAHAAYHSHGAELLLCSLGSMKHVARLRGRGAARFDDHERRVGVLLTAVDGVGPGIAPLLADAVDDAHELTDHGYRRYLVGAGLDEAARAAIFQVLAVLPTDEAFRIVSERLMMPRALPALVTMLERFPARGLRLLAESAASGDDRARLSALLVAGHLRARPELAERLPELGEHVRAAVEAAQASRVAEADADAVPKGLRKGGKQEAPPWAPTAVLPQILLRGRERALPDAAVTHLLEALGKASPKRAASAAVGAALGELDPGSLAEFGWALFEQWRASGEETRMGWAQLRWTGDDETMRRLGALARSWTGQDGIKVPLNGLEVLAGTASDVAILQLQLVADKARPKRLKNKAGKLLAQAAQARGLTMDELGDRMVPDFGLDSAPATGEAAGMTLDYGPRAFRVSFDEQLRPVVIDDAGKLRKALPKPGVKDDPELAPAAHRAFGGLKKDVRAVAADQIRRMERAMVAERRWAPAEFQRLFVDHPLMWHLVRRLVWLHREGGKDTAFRLAEDRTFADVDDEVWTLPDSGAVQIAHPLHLGDGLQVWGETLADYEILQPFPQVGRPIDAFTEQERTSGRLDRFADVEVGVGGLLRLLQSGDWKGLAGGDNGVKDELVRQAPGGRVIILTVNPGIAPWAPAADDKQTLTAVRIAASEADRPGAPKVGFGDLDAITASELLFTLTSLAPPAL
ncbi:DUF4132 domain-containing protein [Actinomadura xylanilytica]|uniref:DUF4132 domain-containing protein n=1 Tax=Actinomadura xylanilytica TaxID=887459 RepID=UPI00255B0748|nr:DUF4132 domain-containing protein [Actinomadura xylanilytica]MDL4770784.1 DUF4132 domain-containing protein [Actinomadura xylanilytica]